MFNTLQEVAFHLSWQGGVARAILDPNSEIFWEDLIDSFSDELRDNPEAENLRGLIEDIASVRRLVKEAQDIVDKYRYL